MEGITRVPIQQRLRLVALAAILACGIVTVGAASSAQAASTTISGQVGELRTYNTFRWKTAGVRVQFTGTVGSIAWGGVNWGWGPNDKWALGLRNRSGVQFSRLEITGPTGGGTFPYTITNTGSYEFAINTKLVSLSSNYLPGGVANFSGTLTY